MLERVEAGQDEQVEGRRVRKLALQPRYLLDAHAVGFSEDVKYAAQLCDVAVQASQAFEVATMRRGGAQRQS
jgi:hypothetical protein